MSGGGGTRVSIPNNDRKLIQEVKKTIGPKHSDEFVHTTLKDCDMDPKEAGRRLKMIHDVKEIASKHNAEDIYTMLKDCNMDPNEAAQRLLYIDTFHEVKKKQDRRKSISSDSSEDYKRTTQGHQWRRNLSSGKETGAINRQERVLSAFFPVHSAKENKLANGNGSYSHKLAPKSSTDVSSSTKDTVVVSSKKTCAVGTIQCEIVKRSSSSKSNAGIKVIKNSENKTRKPKSDVVEKNKVSESLKPVSLSTCDSSKAVSPNQDNKSVELLHEPVKEVVETVSKMNTHSIPEEKPELKTSCHQIVIFPDHLKDPEIYKNLFRFGSLDMDVTVDDSQPLSVTVTEQNDETVPVPEPSQQTDETVPVPEPCQHNDETVPVVKDSISIDPGVKVEESKVEMMMPPVVQRDYGFGYMPHVMGPGPQFVHVDNGGGSVMASGLGQGQSQSQTPTTGENTPVQLSPPVFPYLRQQPYANYIPYYFHPLYIPQNPNHPLFTQQPPPTSTTTTGGFKFPHPLPQFKLGNFTPNPNPNQDLTPSQEKDTNPHSPLQQGEDWGHHHHSVVPNYFYNYPQMAFPPYHSSQPLVYQTVDEKPPTVPPQHRDTT